MKERHTERDCFVGTNVVQLEVAKIISNYKHLMLYVMCIDKYKDTENGM